MSNIGWMHPSYRDLVIDELSADYQWRRIFLQEMNEEGVSLALSDSGGRSGGRTLPLLKDEEDWNLLRHRCVQLVGQSRSLFPSSIVWSLENAVTFHSRDKYIAQQLQHVVRDVCIATLKNWGEIEKLTLGDVRSFVSLSLHTYPLVPLPDLAPVWARLFADLRDYIDKCDKKESLQSPGPLMRWADFVELLADNEPRLLRQLRFPAQYQTELTRIYSIINTSLDSYELPDTVEDATYDLGWMRNVRDSLSKLEPHGGAMRSQLKKILVQVRGQVDELETTIRSLEDEDAELEMEEYEQAIDIKALFADL